LCMQLRIAINLKPMSLEAVVIHNGAIASKGGVLKQLRHFGVDKAFA